ncbi:hypothetical protein LCGC14_0221480 [marine sediment metagenome]|uniref:Uncharacterized protein n=1 Tax=marine sediment metagenome TaxID=412755 RepID=A0A0F9UDN7_9ZZZZ
MKVVVVDIHGTPREIDGNAKVDFDILARWSGNRYLVLASVEGDLFDPLDTKAGINKLDRERGGKVWELRTCSQECYEQYTVFLRSKNRTPYLVAQRRFRNDFR